MTVETNARFVNELNEAYPRNRDLIKEGDDHLRLLKSVLKNTFPGIDSAVVATSEKLNEMDSAFTFEGETMTNNFDTVFAEGKSLDMNESRITNCADPEDPQDVVTMAYLQGSAMWPVGSIFFTADSRNPATIFGFGEWTEFAKGRVIIGTGQTVDGNADGMTFKNGETGGFYNQKIALDNMPEHNHSLTNVKTEEAGDHQHNVNVRIHDYALLNGEKWTCSHGDIAGENKRFQSNIAPKSNLAGAHTHKITGSTENAGSGKPFSIVQPWIACNIWQRTK